MLLINCNEAHGTHHGHDDDTIDRMDVWLKPSRLEEFLAGVVRPSEDSRTVLFFGG